MAPILAKDHLKEVVGLKNDIVWKVFVCPECKTEVTISRYQTAGDLSIMCARCNARWQMQGEHLLDMNHEKDFMSFKVFIKLDEVQKNPPKPAAKPSASAPAGATAGQAGATAPAAAAPKPAAPVAAKPAPSAPVEGTPPPDAQ